MTTLRLRDYQSEAIDAVFAAWNDGMQRPAIVLPTGAGKTVVFSHLVKQFFGRQSKRETALSEGGASRVIILVHRDELADQAIAKLRSVAPGLNVGKVKADANQVYADVMVCSVQTLAVKRRLDDVLRQETHSPVGLIITDECHHAAAESYKKVYAAFPDALQLGVTATMARGDGVGLGSTWEEVVFSRSLLWMISKGYLSDVKAVRVDIDGLDMGAVRASRGDYQAGALGEAMEAAGADKVIARAYKQHAADRQGVVFTPTVETAHSTAAALGDAGITSTVISGETPPADRRLMFDDFRTGRTQVLVNCMVLTEGFDAPWASCAVIARPTQSNPLYIQMVGRVLRPYPGKTEALVLDMVGASSNKLRTLIDLEPGAVLSVREGELLADAVVREAEEANQVPAQGSVAFALKHRELDLFAASEKAWSRTLKGVLFIGCGDTTVFLWRDDAAWAVCTITKGEGPKYTQYRGMDLSGAMAWGEAVAEDYATFGVSRGAAWRKKKPSEKVVALADRLGVEHEGKRAGEVSEAIDIVFKSRMLDPHVPE
jgi:superfamily II DNA or RNA helicase